MILPLLGKSLETAYDCNIPMAKGLLQSPRTKPIASSALVRMISAFFKLDLSLGS